MIALQNSMIKYKGNTLILCVPILSHVWGQIKGMCQLHIPCLAFGTQECVRLRHLAYQCISFLDHWGVVMDYKTGVARQGIVSYWHTFRLSLRLDSDTQCNCYYFFSQYTNLDRDMLFQTKRAHHQLLLNQVKSYVLFWRIRRFCSASIFLRCVCCCLCKSSVTFFTCKVPRSQSKTSSSAFLLSFTTHTQHEKREAGNTKREFTGAIFYFHK